MNKKIYDVTVTISNGIVTYPGDPEAIIKHKKIAGSASVNVSSLSLSAHVGTHVDSPYHYFDEGKSVEEFPPEILVGPCLVCDMGDADQITRSSLEKLPIDKYRRVLLKTKNSLLWKNPEHKFIEDHVHITADAAEYLASFDITIVGIDYLSIDSYHDKNSPAHNILLKKGLLLIEGLNLLNIPPGPYELICAPLKIKNSDGSPARVFLRKL